MIDLEVPDVLQYAEGDLYHWTITAVYPDRDAISDSTNRFANRGLNTTPRGT